MAGLFKSFSGVLNNESRGVRLVHWKINQAIEMGRESIERLKRKEIEHAPGPGMIAVATAFIMGHTSM